MLSFMISMFCIDVQNEFSVHHQLDIGVRQLKHCNKMNFEQWIIHVTTNGRCDNCKNKHSIYISSIEKLYEYRDNTWIELSKNSETSLIPDPKNEALDAWNEYSNFEIDLENENSYIDSYIDLKKETKEEQHSRLEAMCDGVGDVDT